jgi:hypothetical protein
MLELVVSPHAINTMSKSPEFIVLLLDVVVTLVVVEVVSSA